jgi:hypothetical protein
VQKIACYSHLAHAAGVGVVGSAHRSRHRAVLGNRDLRGRPGGRDLGGGDCASENEGDDGCANDELHFGLTPKVCIYLLLVAMALAHAAGVGVVGSAHGSRHGAVLGNSDLGRRRGGGDLGGSNCTSENEGDDGCTNDELHFGLTPKVVFTS